jgi:hypothetical protein
MNSVPCLKRATLSQGFANVERTPEPDRKHPRQPLDGDHARDGIAIDLTSAPAFPNLSDVRPLCENAGNRLETSME